jgi:hypothetical protein
LSNSSTVRVAASAACPVAFAKRPAQRRRVQSGIFQSLHRDLQHHPLLGSIDRDSRVHLPRLIFGPCPGSLDTSDTNPEVAFPLKDGCSSPVPFDGLRIKDVFGPMPIAVALIVRARDFMPRYIARNDILIPTLSADPVGDASLHSSIPETSALASRQGHLPSARRIFG